MYHLPGRLDICSGIAVVILYLCYVIDRRKRRIKTGLDPRKKRRIIKPESIGERWKNLNLGTQKEAGNCDITTYAKKEPRIKGWEA